MARSTKTKHVLDLVGAEPVKKPAAPKSPAAEKVEKAPPVPKIVETLEQQQQHQEPPAQQKKVPQEAPIHEAPARETLVRETTVETPVQENPVQGNPVQEAPAQAMPAQAMPAQKISPVPPAEEREPVHKPMITAIVCELINQELGSVAERFHLSLTDANLWALTRAALEEVRPEFSADSDDREEKLERLRPLVIGAMAKVAIKLSAKGRK